MRYVKSALTLVFALCVIFALGSNSYAQAAELPEVTAAAQPVSDNVYKLVVSTNYGEPVKGLKFTLSYNAEQIVPVSAGDTENTLAISSGCGELGCFRITRDTDVYDKASALWYVTPDGKRAAFSYEMESSEKTSATGELDMFEFYFRLKPDVKEEYLNKTSLCLEADPSDDAILAGMYPNSDDRFNYLCIKKNDSSLLTMAGVQVKFKELSYPNMDRDALTSTEICLPDDYTIEVSAQGTSSIYLETINKGLDGDYSEYAETHWSISSDPAPAGVTINEDYGFLTVSPQAQAGRVAVTVSVTSGGVTVTDTKEIEITKEAPILTSVKILKGDNPITGDSMVVPIKGEKTITYTAQAYDQYGEEMSSAGNAVWSSAAPPAGTSFAGGIMTVSEGADIGSFNITAAISDKTATIPIEVVKFSADWRLTTAQKPVYRAANADIIMGEEVKTLSYTLGDGQNGELSGSYSVKDAETVQNAGQRTIEVAFTVSDAESNGEFKGLVLTETYNINILKAVPSAADLQYTIPEDHVYNAGEQGIGEVTGVMGLGEIRIKYGGEEITPIDAATYEVTANIADGENFTANIINLGYYSIAKANITDFNTAAPAYITKCMADVEKAKTCSDIGLPTVIFAAFDNNIPNEKLEITGWNRTLAQLKEIDASVEDVKVELTPAFTYPDWASSNIAPPSFVLTITSKYKVSVNVTAPKNCTYGTALGNPGAKQTALDNGVDPMGGYTYFYSGKTDAGLAYASDKKPTEAGSYAVTATLMSQTHYGVSSAAEFTIEKAQLTNLKPEISGTAAVGNTLTAVLEGVDSGELAFSWVIDGSCVSNTNTYTPVPADSNGSLSLTVSGRDVNYTGISKTVSVTIAKMAVGGAVSIVTDGLDITAGKTLRADISGLTPSEAQAAVAYQWYRDGEAIENATQAEYTVAKEDANGSLTVSVEALNDFTGVLRSAAVKVEKPVAPPAPSSGGAAKAEIDTEPAQNGKVVIIDRQTEPGDRVSVKVSPDKGYVVDKIIAVDSEGNEIEVSRDGAGSYSFVMPDSAIIVKAEFVPVSQVFKDVSVSSGYADAVAWAVESGVTAGTSDSAFSPNAVCSRAQIVTLLWRAYGEAEAAGESSLRDVPQSAYYGGAVNWAAEKGIAGGTGGGYFNPDGSCTRAQIISFLWRAAGSPSPVDGGGAFSDVSPDDYFHSAVLWAAEQKITTGTGDGQFSPNAACTRAQAVTLLYNALAK